MKLEEKIFSAYFLAKKRTLKFSEVKELSKIKDSSLTRKLKEMANLKLITKTKHKSNTYYKIRDEKLFVLEFSKLALKKFQNLNVGVRIPLKNFLKEVGRDIFTIVLFGSASKKQEKQGSDIDILVVSVRKNNLEKLKERTNDYSNYPISLFNCNIRDFISGKDNIVIQARKTGFPIYNEQNFYEVLINGY